MHRVRSTLPHPTSWPPVSPVKVLAASPLSGSVSCWALWRWERDHHSSYPSTAVPQKARERGEEKGGRYGGRRRHLFSFIIKLKNPADSQNAPGGKRFSVSWVSQLPSGPKGLACYMSIKPVVKNTEEYLNAVSLSFINRCPSVQSLNGGGTLEDKGSCFLLCSHLQAVTDTPPSPTQKKPRFPSAVTTLVSMLP